MKHRTKVGTVVIVAMATMLASAPAWAPIYVKIPHLQGDVKGPDGELDWLLAGNFSFGVEREMKESGEKGGTEDINIGIGELQECTISKGMDRASPYLAQAAINGNTIGPCEVCFSDTEVGGVPVCYAHYAMERCYVKSWSTSGDADDRPTEEVAFYFNKIAFGFDDGRGASTMSWDQEHDRPWLEGLDWLFDFEPEPR